MPRTRAAPARRIAVAFACLIEGGPAATNDPVANCAGSNLADGGALSAGGAMGGDGIAVAATLHLDDPTFTVGCAFGGSEGYPGLTVAGGGDVGEPQIVGAMGIGGHFPYPAGSLAASDP